MGNRANAVKCRHPWGASLHNSPNGEIEIGMIMPDDLLLPADLLPQSDENGAEWIPLVVWVRADQVMRCGGEE